MKLAVAKANAFVEKPDKSLRVFLVYGPDAGMVKENAARLLRHFVPDLNDPFLVTTLESSNIAKDAARLRDEMASLSLLGGKRAVQVLDCGDELFPQIEKLLADMPQTENVCVLEAGELDKRSKLRSCIEEASGAMAIPCYPEEGAALESRIRSILQEQGFSASREALSRLCEVLPPDRIGMRLELEKLATYALNPTGARAVVPGAPATGTERTAQKNIGIDHVEAILTDGGAEDLDLAVSAAASGEPAKLEKQLSRLRDGGTSPVALLRTALRHTLRLYEARAKMESQGQSADEAMKSLRPPVFFKQEGSFRGQLRRLSPRALEKAVSMLLRAEAQAKSTGIPSELVAEKVLRDIAGG